MLTQQATTGVYSLPGFHEPFSALSHLAGALIFAAMSVALIQRSRGSARRIALLSVFSFSGVLLLAMSGVYHMLVEGSTGRAVLARLDKAAIFALIAGTHTPVQGMFFRGFARWGGLIAMWGVTATGITLVSIFHDSMPNGLGTSLYLLLGWIAGTAGITVWRRLGTAQVSLLIGGGLVYTVGAILLVLEWPTLIPGVFGPHELWHVAVLVALGLHWTFFFRNAHRNLDA